MRLSVDFFLCEKSVGSTGIAVFSDDIAVCNLEQLKIHHLHFLLVDGAFLESAFAIKLYP